MNSMNRSWSRFLIVCQNQRVALDSHKKGISYKQEPSGQTPPPLFKTAADDVRNAMAKLESTIPNTPKLRESRVISVVPEARDTESGFPRNTRLTKLK